MGEDPQTWREVGQKIFRAVKQFLHYTVHVAIYEHETHKTIFRFGVPPIKVPAVWASQCSLHLFTLRKEKQIL